MVGGGNDAHAGAFHPPAVAGSRAFNPQAVARNGYDCASAVVFKRFQMRKYFDAASPLLLQFFFDSCRHGVSGR